MATAAKRRKRARGRVEKLPSGSPRVKVYAGIDPVTKKRHYPTDVRPAPGAQTEAQRVLTRLLNEVDERRRDRDRGRARASPEANRDKI